MHQDLKPSNVMLDRTSEEPFRAVIIDFGLAFHEQDAGKERGDAPWGSGFSGSDGGSDVERTWHIRDSRGQILALAFR